MLPRIAGAWKMVSFFLVLRERYFQQEHNVAQSRHLPDGFSSPEVLGCERERARNTLLIHSISRLIGTVLA